MKSKITAAILMIISAVYLKAEPLLQYSKLIDVNINAGLMTFVLSDSFVLSITFIAVILIFSDLPFKRPKPYFLIIRTGKRKWMLAHQIYIAIVSLAIVIIISVSYILFMEGRIYFGSGWGKIAVRICEGNDPAAIETNLLIHKDVLAALSPAKASLWATVNTYILIFIFGNICITFNMFLNEYAGTIVCGIMTFIHMLRGFASDFLLTYFSPVSWISVNNIDFNGNSAMPDYIYPICVYGVVVYGLWVFNLWATRRGSELTEKIL